MMNKQYDLVIFDLDGTLSEWKTWKLLPGVYDWFENHGDEQVFACCSNQGGVGLGHWMRTENFGNPDKYPDEAAIRAGLRQVSYQLPERFQDALFDNTMFCFAYQSRQGNWSPKPPGKEDDPEWARNGRKPAPGMLMTTMERLGVDATHTLCVGDRDEDEQAARAAGCDFMSADRFFARTLEPAFSGDPDRT